MICLIIKIALQPDILKRALIVALVVGFLLNVINQGDAALAEGITVVHWPKFLLTFCVPFLVSMYTAVSMTLKFKPGDRAPAKLKLSCPDCKTEVLIQANEVIPTCVKCNQDTQWQLNKTEPS